MGISISEAGSEHGRRLGWRTDDNNIAIFSHGCAYQSGFIRDQKS